MPTAFLLSANKSIAYLCQINKKRNCSNLAYGNNALGAESKNFSKPILEARRTFYWNLYSLYFQSAYLLVLGALAT